jgi:hypothetical protein
VPVPASHAVADGIVIEDIDAVPNSKPHAEPVVEPDSSWNAYTVDYCVPFQCHCKHNCLSEPKRLPTWEPYAVLQPHCVRIVQQLCFCLSVVHGQRQCFSLTIVHTVGSSNRDDESTGESQLVCISQPLWFSVSIRIR